MLRSHGILLHFISDPIAFCLPVNLHFFLIHECLNYLPRQVVDSRFPNTRSMCNTSLLFERKYKNHTYTYMHYR